MTTRLQRGADRPAPRVRRRPRAAILLAAAALLNAGAGIALGIALTPDADEEAPPPPPRVQQMIGQGDLRLTLPAGWRPLEQAPDVPGLDAVVTAARGPSADLVFGVLPPQSPTLLPAALIEDADGAVPAPMRVEIDGRQALHYVGLAGGRTDVYAVPTTAGVATVACVSENSVSLAQGCDAALEGIRVERAAPIPADARAAFAIGLPATVARLNRAREAGRRALARQRSARGRARVSRRLGRAYATTAARLTPLAGDDAATTRIVGLLERLSADHRRLAAASARRSGDAARRAGARIRVAERRLAGALGRWSGPAQAK